MKVSVLLIDEAITIKLDAESDIESAIVRSMNAMTATREHGALVMRKKVDGLVFADEKGNPLKGVM